MNPTTITQVFHRNAEAFPKLSVSLFPPRPPHSPSLSTGESLTVQDGRLLWSLLRRLRMLKCNCRYMTDVVDAGQGPAGLAAAQELNRQGAYRFSLRAGRPDRRPAAVRNSGLQALEGPA